MNRKQKPLTNKAGEVRELTRADFRKFRPAIEVVPQVVAAYRRSRGRPAGSDKTPVSLRIDNDILAFFKAKGQGWQTRINDTLRVFVEVAR